MIYTLRETKIEYAKKRLEYLKLCDKIDEIEKPYSYQFTIELGDPWPSPEQMPEIPKEINDEISKMHKELEYLGHKLNKFSNYLYSIPYIRPFMKAWMFDCWIKCNCCDIKKSDKECEVLIDALIDPVKFTEQYADNLLSDIEKSIAQFGIFITDRGCDHIGAPCTDAERDIFYGWVITKYNKAVTSGYLTPKIAWFNPGFHELWEYDEIKKFLADNQ